MDFNQPIGLQGRFTLHIIRESGEREQVADFPNLVLDNGLDMVMGGADSIATCIDYCAVGTGNTPPSPEQTNLVNSRAGTRTSFTGVTPFSFNYTDPVPWQQLVVSRRFAVGAASGNLAEIGMGVSNSSMFSRALIVDADGNPTTITVLPTEALDVTYTLRLYILPTPATGSATLGGTEHSFTLLPYLVAGDLAPTNNMLVIAWIPSGNLGTTNLYSAITSLGAPTVAPVGTTRTAGSWGRTKEPYVTGSFYRDMILRSSVGTVSTGNVAGGVFRLEGNSRAAVKMQFVPPIPVDVTQSLAITVRVSLGRYTP